MNKVIKMVEYEYNRIFEDTLDLVNSHMQKCKDNGPRRFVLQIKKIVQNFKDKRIGALKKELCLVDNEVPK